MENEVISKLELKVLGGGKTGKTKYIVNTANHFYKDKKILVVSLENEKSILYSKYNLEQSDSIIVIDSPITVGKIKEYLVNLKPDYLLIDYLQLLETEEQFDNSNQKLKYVLDFLYDYIKEYQVNILVADYMLENETPDKYKNNIYEKCHQVWVLIDNIITRIK